MKITLPRQTKTIKALSAAFVLFLLPGISFANGGHKSANHNSGKQCHKTQCDNSLSVPLYVNGNKRVGLVSVRLEQSDLKVSYQVEDGWSIEQTHLDIADSYNGLHIDANGAPQVEAFPYKTSHITPVKSVNYTIGASQWPLGTQLYLSAQATVVSDAAGKCQQHSATTSHHHDDDGKFHFRKEDDKNHGKKHGKRKHYSKDSSHDYDTHDGKHRDDSDDDHYDYHKGTVSKSITNEAWATGEVFPGQQYAAYFTYTLKSCDSEQPQQLSSIQFSDAIYTVTEGEPQVLITVVRSGDLQQAASVDFTTVDGTAINGVDYGFASGVLEFAPGQASAQFAVYPIDDSEVEDVENVSLQLSNPVNATLGQQNTATLEINDNDVAPASVIEFSQADYTDPERTPVVTITVVRSGDLSIEAQVDFTTADGTATVNSDYIGNSGTLVFPAGVDTITFQVMVINDRLVEANETVLLQLSNPVGAELGAQSDATLTILDDDGMPS